MSACCWNFAGVEIGGPVKSTSGLYHSEKESSFAVSAQADQPQDDVGVGRESELGAFHQPKEQEGGGDPAHVTECVNWAAKRGDPAEAKRE